MNHTGRGRRPSKPGSVKPPGVAAALGRVMRPKRTINDVKKRLGMRKRYQTGVVPLAAALLQPRSLIGRSA